MKLLLPQFRGMILDDDIRTCRFFQTRFKEIGLHFDYCLSADDGMKAITDKPPQVLILDLEFPNSVYQGINVLFNIFTEKLPIKVVVLSRNINRMIEKQLYALGKPEYAYKTLSRDVEFVPRTEDFEVIALKIQNLLSRDSDPEVVVRNGNISFNKDSGRFSCPNGHETLHGKQSVLFGLLMSRIGRIQRYAGLANEVHGGEVGDPITYLSRKKTGIVRKLAPLGYGNLIENIPNEGYVINEI